MNPSWHTGTCFAIFLVASLSPFFLSPGIWILWDTWVVEDNHIDEKYYTHYETCFRLKLLLSNILQIKLAFMQKNLQLSFEASCRYIRSCIEGACWVRNVLMAKLLLIFRVLPRQGRLRQLQRHWRVRPRGLHQLSVAEMESLRVLFIRCAFWL